MCTALCVRIRVFEHFRCFKNKRHWNERVINESYLFSSIDRSYCHKFPQDKQTFSEWLSSHLNDFCHDKKRELPQAFNVSSATAEGDAYILREDFI